MYIYLYSNKPVLPAGCNFPYFPERAYSPLGIHDTWIWIANTYTWEASQHVKNPLSGNITTRLRMYKYAIQT